MLVAKFGGTSMGGAQAMNLAGTILKNDSRYQLVVVSAMTGVTSQLIKLNSAINLGQNDLAHNIFTDLKEIHLRAGVDLNFKSTPFEIELMNLLNRLEELIKAFLVIGSITPQGQDEILSFGEILSSHLFHFHLKENLKLEAMLFDARSVITTNAHYSDAAVDLSETRKKVQARLLPALTNKNILVVTQGFIGSGPHNETTTIGRGGSDYSASILSSALGEKLVEELYIWTDVEGVFTLDPKIHPHAKVIAELSYQEAAELANLGAKVLHPHTLLPVQKVNIPVFVGSTFNPSASGTWIKEKVNHRAPKATIKALAKRQDQCLLTLTRIKRHHSVGLLANIFQILAKYHISVDLITTSEISTAITFQGPPDQFTEKITEELEVFCDVSLESNFTLISVIGEDMIHTKGIVGEIFNSLNDFTIRFICMGSGPHNLSFLTLPQEADPILLKLHQNFLDS
jgi:aspartate kinase